MTDPYNAFLSDIEIPSSAAGPLAGIRIAVKDNISTTDIPTTCASKILLGYIPPYAAHAVELLKAAGATISGYSNMDNVRMGATQANTAVVAALPLRD